MQNRVVLHEICARRSGDPEAVTALLRDANNAGSLPRPLHEIVADALETVQNCCNVNKPPRDFIEVGSAIMVKWVVCLLERGIEQMQAANVGEESEGKQE